MSNIPSHFKQTKKQTNKQENIPKPQTYLTSQGLSTGFITNDKGDRVRQLLQQIGNSQAFPAFFKVILTVSYMIYFRETGLVNIFWLAGVKKPP